MSGNMNYLGHGGNALNGFYRPEISFNQTAILPRYEEEKNVTITGSYTSSSSEENTNTPREEYSQTENVQYIDTSVDYLEKLLKNQPIGTH